MKYAVRIFLGGFVVGALCVGSFRLLKPSKPGPSPVARADWEESMSFLEHEALANPSKDKRTTADLMVRLGRSGFQLGFESGAKLCD